MAKPVLFFGFGNISRCDDALGPLFLEFVENHYDLACIDLLTDFQLQIEHALDLENRKLVLFVDASVKGSTSFEFTELEQANEIGYTTHAMSPEAVMSVYRSITGQPPPPCFLLGIKGESFGLGERVSANASINLNRACRFAESLLANPDPAAWRHQADRDCHA